jgi:isopenicillin N synthase-like dioxygenase
MSKLGKALLRGVALGLGIPEDWFAHNICKEPTELFRIFHYPPPDLSNLKPGEHPGWGVGEHTDYGLITLLA